MQGNRTDSRQPTHHGYAINVKDDERYDYDDALSYEDAELVYGDIAYGFWQDAAEVARAHGFKDVYSEGRMGGWCVPQPQPHTDDMWEYEITAWERDKFRPFERDILALFDEYQAEAREALRDAGERAKREPAERAYWEARDVETIG